MNPGSNRRPWCALGVGVGTLIAALHGIGTDAWKQLGLPVMTPRVADARILTAAARCEDLGYDVLRTNPCDQVDRVLNYPRLWTDISDLFLSSPELLAGVFSFVYLAGVVLAFRHIRARGASLLMFTMATLSPPALLGFERGNNDLLIVGMTAFAVWLLARRTPLSFAAGAATLATLGVLKLFPVVLLLVALVAAEATQDARDRSWNRRTTVLLGASMAWYLLDQVSDIVTIIDEAAQPEHYAYGLGTLREVLRRGGAESLFGNGSGYTALVAVAALAVWFIARPAQRRGGTELRVAARRAARSFRTLADDETGLLFLSGVALFATTMLLNNYPYKLLVLVLLSPRCLAVLERDRSDGPNPDGRWASRILGLSASLWILVPLELEMTPTGQAAAVMVSTLLGLALIGSAVALAASGLPDEMTESKTHRAPSGKTIGSGRS